MKASSERLGTEKISKILYELSLPSTFAMLVNALYNVVDTIFVGFIGKNAIAALTIVFPIQMILGAIAIGTGVGASSYISRSLGANKREEAHKTISQSALLFVGLSIILVPIIILNLNSLLKIFGATPALMPQAREYSSIIIYGMISIFFNMTFNSIIRGEGNAKVPMVSMLIGAAGNIILDPIFIFGFKMGVSGAAYATILSNVLANIYLIRFILSGKMEVKIMKKYLKPDFRIIKEIYKIGFTNILMNAANSFVLAIVNRQLAFYGEYAIAALGIVIRFNSFVFMPCFGINQGLLPIVGYNFGANKKVRVSKAVWVASKYGTYFMILGWIAFVFFPRPLAYIFTRDPELITMTATAFRYNALAFPIVGTQVILSGFFQGVGKGLPALAMSMLRQLGILIPAIYILPRFFGLNGIWLSYAVSDLLSSILTIILAVYIFKVLNIPIFYQRIEKKRKEIH